MMRVFVAVLLLWELCSATKIRIDGRFIYVDGKRFYMKGINYAPVPIGNHPTTADFFDENFKDQWMKDIDKLRAMNINTIRVYGWRKELDHSAFMDYLYNDGKDPIYLVLTQWVARGQNLEDPAFQNSVVQEFQDTYSAVMDHDALLMYLVGNELNANWMYVGQPDKFMKVVDLVRAKAREVEGGDASLFHPISTTLTDAESLTITGDYASSVDAWCVNLYRGSSFAGYFDDYKPIKPLFVTEFGTDAYNEANHVIDEGGQARVIRELLTDLTSHSSVNSGGCIFEYTDEWWKECDACGNCNPSTQDAGCSIPMDNGLDGFEQPEFWGVCERVFTPGGFDSIRCRQSAGEIESFYGSWAL